MSRTISILLALVVLIGAFLIIKQVKNSYKLLPFDEKNPLQASGSQFQTWREFSAPNGNFAIKFPTLPQHAANKITDPRTGEKRQFDIFAAADGDGTAYMVSTTTFSDKVEEVDMEKVLRSAVNDMLERNKENKLKMSKLGNFHDSRALDFSIENGEMTIAGKAILHDKTLYVLSMVDKTDSFNTQSFDFFTNSFIPK